MMRRIGIAALVAFGLAVGITPAKALLDGTGYTVVAPLYTGNAASGGNLSYLRFYNPNPGDVTFSVSVVGSPSGRLYGTASYVVPSGASPQYPLTGSPPNDILSKASAGALTGGDTGYALYLLAPGITTANAFQHVIYNGTNGFFENVSACTYSANVNYADFNQTLINVHTPSVAGGTYPATITVHNYQNAAVSFDVTVTDAADGTILGIVPITVQPNASYTQPATYYYQQLGFTPTATQYHTNMTFSPTADQGPSAVVSQFIHNTGLSIPADVSMTLFCSINQ